MYLGLDLGTSGLKALVMDEDGQVVTVATAALEVSRPAQGWSEQDPADWIKACCQVLTELKPYLSAVKGIGIAGHMHGVVLMDEQDQVLRPCLLWNDVRAQAQAADMDRQPLFQHKTGTIVFPGFNGPKMAWVRDNEPDVWQKTKVMVFPKDYLAFWLTGEKQAEPSDASGSALFDGATGQWCPALCAAAGLSLDILPPIVGSDQARGGLRSDLAAEFGFNASAVVAGGAGDNAAAATGIAALERGQGLVSLGTSGVLLTVNDRWSPQAETAVHTFAHAASGRFIQMGVTLTATDSLSWLAELTGQEPAELAASAGQLPKAPGNITYLPYLAGERTPHNFGAPMGAFVGLSRKHGLSDMAKAVMEGVAFSIADCALALEQAGAPVQTLTAVGGGAQSAYWLQILATVLQRPLALRSRTEHAAALGAAYLAAAAAQSKSVLALPLYQRAAENRMIEPDITNMDGYQAALAVFRRRSVSLR